MKLTLTRLCALFLMLAVLCLPLVACKDTEDEIPENERADGIHDLNTNFKINLDVSDSDKDTAISIQ